MDSRKVQTVGGGTYTVSLPKEWAESHGISGGDTVDLHTHIDGVLVVQAGDRTDDLPERTAVRVTTDDTRALERTVRAAYAAGTTAVTLEAADAFTSDQRRVVDRVARTLPGVSVVDASETEITVRTLLDADEVSVVQSVRQLKFVALSMHRDATAALTGELDSKTLADRDDQADRLHALIDRSFMRGLARLEEVDALGATRPELFVLWRTTRELERVADHAEGIASAASRIGGVIDETLADDICELAAAARTVVSDAVCVVVGDADDETAQQALAARDDVRGDVFALEDRVGESPNADGRVLTILDRVRRTAAHGGNVAELGLRNAILRDEPTRPP